MFPLRKNWSVHHFQGSTRKLTLQQLNQKLICFLCKAFWKLQSIMRTQNIKEFNYVFIQHFLWIVISIVKLVKSVSFSILLFRIQLSSKIFLSFKRSSILLPKYCYTLLDLCCPIHEYIQIKLFQNLTNFAFKLLYFSHFSLRALCIRSHGILSAQKCF